MHAETHAPRPQYPACAACLWFRHDRRFPSGASCTEPGLKTPTDWWQACQTHCNGERAPFWTPRTHSLDLNRMDRARAALPSGADADGAVHG